MASRLPILLKTAGAGGDDTVLIRLKPARDRMAYAAAALAVVLSTTATTYFARHHILLGVRDSFSHLEISRRVVVGQSTGIAQFGGDWLPLPQALQALFAWNWTLYRTGLAGSLVSGAAYVASATLIYGIIRTLTGGRRWAAIAGALVFMTNPNVLYEQSTSMDEMPFYAFTLAVVYALLRWSETNRASYVLTAGIASMCAMLCRYEAWFLGLVYVPCVVLMARRLGHSWRDTRGLGLVVALFGVGIAASGWLVYNWMIFGSPVNFLYGPHSGAHQPATRPTEAEIGSWPLTLKAYGTAITSDIGLVVLALAVAALVVFAFRERRSANSLPVLALMTVVPLIAYTVEAGLVPIGTPTVNGGLTNFRFGLIVILPSAIVIGYLLSTLSKVAAAVTGTAVLALTLTALSAASFVRQQVVLEAEARADSRSQILPAEAGDYLRKQTKGPILIDSDTVRNERVAFPVLDRTVNTGARGARGGELAQSLRDPKAAGIDVIVMRSAAGDRDRVYTALHSSPELSSYKVAYQNADYTIYVRRTGG